MNSFLKEKEGVGVIVCRMQVPYLTDSHKNVIKTVLNRHQRVVLFLGTSGKPIEFKNPYPFEFRRNMVLKALIDEKTFLPPANLSVVPLPDNEDNAMWVRVLDSLIGSFLNLDEEAILYGGRDSFIGWYRKDNGKHKCTELTAIDYDSGTELRTISANSIPEYTPESAQAILWALKQIKR